MMDLLSTFHFASVKKPSSRSRSRSARARQFVIVTLSRCCFQSVSTAVFRAVMSAFFVGGAMSAN